MGSRISFYRRMNEFGIDGNSLDRDSDSDRDIATVLQYLIRSGQVHIVPPSSEHLFHDISDDELFATSSPPNGAYVENSPDTSQMEGTDISNNVMLSSGALNDKSLKSEKNHYRPLASLLAMLQWWQYDNIWNRGSGGVCTPDPLPVEEKSRPSFVYSGTTFLTVCHIILQRELGMNGRKQFSRGDRCQINQRFLPNRMKPLDNYQNKVFCGAFARGGDIFMTASQDYCIRIYDSQTSHFKLIKVVEARDVGWSVLDTAVSPDGCYFVYCSWSESIHICNVFGDYEVHEALPLCPDERRFCVFALRFSQDGREILGGANDECLYVYNRDARQRTLKIHAHEDDVNTVAFADSTSQILFSGGDDGLCKVWDRRTLCEHNPKPVGILVGHEDGITYVDSKGDGRHLITNSKDQSIKLWDMRRFSPESSLEGSRRAVQSHNWDYRWQRVPMSLNKPKKKLEGDTSLMTYRGHSVLQTLIRCHFSPEATTGQRYIYTGCAQGRIVIYDVLTGHIKTVLSGHKTCVRDVSWHPYRNEIISSSWDGTVAKWTYHGKHEIDSDDEDSEPMSDHHERNTGTRSRVRLRRSLRLANQRRKAASERS